MDTTDPAKEFGRRVRVARVWAGYTRQSDFGEALAAEWPDWPVRTNVKRVELGERTLNYDEQKTWAKRIAEFTGVPQWFMVSGWEGAVQQGSLQQQLEDLKETVRQHDELLLKAVRDRPGPFENKPADAADQAATTLRRAATEARQKQAERPARRPAAKKRTQG